MPYFAPEGTEIIEHLGSGGVFDVALVRAAGRALICKRLNSRARREQAGRAALAREARALALVRHPALPALVRVGSDGHGPFVLETRVEGVSLRALAAAWQARGQPLPRSLVAHVIRTAIATLAEVQEMHGADGRGPAELVHGDLDPDHLLLGPIGDVGVVDLGAARFRGMEAELETGDRGTLPFVAPEVARGESPPTRRSDVYSLAATLAFFATGEPLTRAREEAAMLVEIGEAGLRIEALDAIDALSPEQRGALARALARDPSERPESARALLAAFDMDSHGRVLQGSAS
jgi:serine/threonine protein kinase